MTVVIGLSGGEHLYQKIADALSINSIKAETRFFPDGELYLRLPVENLNKEDVLIVQSLYGQPNNKLIEYIFAAKTAKDLGAHRVIGIIPYLSYARQDRRFKPGEAISLKIVADMIYNSGTDQLIVVDMHLHRVRGSELESIFKIPVSNVTAMPLFGDLFKDVVKNGIVIGPDDEAIEFAKAAATKYNGKYTNFSKTRLGDREVNIVADKTIDFSNKDVLIVDDIISTGGTIITAVKLLRELNVKDIYVATTHALLVEGALDKLKNLHLKDLASSNTVPSPITKVDITPVIVEELKKII
ncbi:MAG: ribose-phosphate diphosphokinase [Thermoprotei archaeon]|jgi:ribose-phosphate pyrophosphokinase